MRYGFIEQHRSAFAVEKMCQTLEVARSGYYRRQIAIPGPREQENQKITEEIRKIHGKSRRIYGSPRIYAELKAMGIRCGKNRVCRLMREAGIRSRIRRKYRPTTESKHGWPVAPNWLNRRFSSDAPGRMFVGDITYIWTREGWLYLAVVIDLYSRRVRGWAAGETINGELTLEALDQALSNAPRMEERVFHSDRGVQYAADAFRNRLSQQGILQSMSRKGNCYDNAVAESFFHSLKTEWLSFLNFSTRGEAKSAVFEYIEMFYNRQRRHSSLGFLSPWEFEKKVSAT